MKPVYIDLNSRSALIVVDVQNDFCPGGALAVPGGDDIVPALNGWIGRFRESGLPVVFTQDWHPVNHCSFAVQGGIWPVHCVQDTTGSAFHPGLEVPPLGDNVSFFKKGFLPDREAYSGFDARFDGSPEGRTLGDWLRARSVTSLYIGGLATDYCVKATVLDGLKEGFNVAILPDAIMAVEVNPGDGVRALAEMKAAGAKIA